VCILIAGPSQGAEEGLDAHQIGPYSQQFRYEPNSCRIHIVVTCTQNINVQVGSLKHKHVLISPVNL
jgi:hypothetical protein